ncbi:MAG: replicative DNA helicase [Rhodobacteraceae bacterium]|nr:replicative DNA helicase [Paracoccaceae bacterium]
MNEIHRFRPPSDSPFAACIEAEQQVLGMLLLDSAGMSLVINKGGSDLFADPVHQRIFEVMFAKHKDNHLVSPITVNDIMRADDGLKELGGGGYLTRLAVAAMSASALNGYLTTLSGWRRKRDILAAMSDAHQAITKGDDPADHIAARLESALMASEPAGAQGPVSMHKAVNTAMTQIAAAFSGDEGNTVKTGIGALDDILGALHPGDLGYLGARPSMGKTGLALSIALNVSRAGHEVAIASLEMTPEAMAMRALSEQTAQQGRAVEYSAMRLGDMSDSHVKSLHQAAPITANLPITFLPRQYNDIGALSAGIKQIARRRDLRLVIVDYLQLMRSAVRGNTNEQVSDISKSLKALAMQLEVPILALSQLSRAVEQREDKRPQLSDLRDSGSIEQDADTVMFCYRPEYYLERSKPRDDDKDEADEWQTAMNKVRNRLDIIVAKQRAGAIGTAQVRFNPALNLIWED